VFKLQQQLASSSRAIDAALGLIADRQGQLDSRGRAALAAVRDVLLGSRR
jgi:hypothetical protein